MSDRESVANEATQDSMGGTNFSGQPNVAPQVDNREIIAALRSYMTEAQDARRNGMNPRDAKWKQNLDLYWNRVDFSKKAAWQAREVMPEVASYVDRFAAALKEALIQTPDGFYTIVDPADSENDIAASIKKATDVWLTSVGRNQIGQLLPFSAVFEEQVKLGAIMASSAVTTWKNDYPGGRVAVESVDPQMVWLDHTNRNLYRVRRLELDRHELSGMKAQIDGKGVPIFDEYEMAKLESSLFQKTQADADRTGNGQDITSGRRPIILDEYVATVVGSDGKLLSDRALMVLANEQYLIRGPEANPFWHGKDWLTYTPFVTAPLSAYGRSYMEDFGSVASTFNSLTNMIIDAVHMTSMKAYAVVPGMLLNPGQMQSGLSPNKIFMLDDGYKAEDFAKALDLGTLPAESVKIWEALKQELSEAADMNEIGLGQFAPNSRTSATEINQTQQSSSALIRSVAQTVETRFLDPTLDLVWKTGMQHAKADDERMIQSIGQEMWSAMIANRKLFVRRPITFQARGISMIISRSQQLKALIGVLGVFAQSPQLLQAFLQKIDIGKLVERIFLLSGVDLKTLQLSEREKMIQSITQPIQQAQDQTQGAPPPGPSGQSAVDGAVSSLGIGRGA